MSQLRNVFVLIGLTCVLVLLLNLINVARVLPSEGMSFDAVLALISAGAFAFIAVLSVRVGMQHVMGTIDSLRDSLGALSRGELAPTKDLAPEGEGSGELAQVWASAQELRQRLWKMQQAAELARAGDLKAEIPSTGKEDLLAESLNGLLRSFRGSLGGLKSSLSALERGHLSAPRPAQAEEASRLQEVQEVVDALHQRLSQLSRAAEQVRAGDLTVEIPVRGEDDVLGGSLAEMLRSLQTTLTKVRTASNQVADMAKQISTGSSEIAKGAETQTAATEETSATMEEIAAQIQGVARLSEGLASNVDETSAAIQEMGATIEEVARSADTLLRSVEETSATFQEMAASIQSIARSAQAVDELTRKTSEDASSGGRSLSETVDKITSVAKAMQESSLSIERLGRRSQEIGKIVRVIEEIADQTNLLALNAAIEAARAGDAGRGFAVVAEEVRKLAERAVKATREIGEVIESVQEDTSQVVKVTRENIQEVQRGAGLVTATGETLARIISGVEKASLLVSEVFQATQEQSKATGEILRTTKEMGEMSTQVANAAREQLAGSRQIMSAVESMNQMTQQVATAAVQQKAGGEQVLRAVENISVVSRQNLTAVEQMSRASQGLADQAGQLQEQIKIFRV